MHNFENIDEIKQISLNIMKLAMHNIKTDGFAAPVIISINNETSKYFAMQWANDTEKEAMINKVIPMVRMSSPELVLFVSEAWAAEGSDAQDGIRPSAHPNKKEIVIVSCKTKKHYGIILKEILRDSSDLPYFDNSPPVEMWSETPNGNTNVYSRIIDAMIDTGGMN